MGRTFRTMSTQTLTPVVYQGTLESGIGSPVFPVLGGVSRFPIPEWPGIGNRETGRFPFGQEPGIGVPIRRAGDFKFLVCAREGDHDVRRKSVVHAHIRRLSQKHPRGGRISS